MKIAKLYVSEVAQSLIETNDMAAQAFEEVRSSILDNVTSGSDHFILNCTHKNCNGVVPVKERCYEILEEKFGWYIVLPYFLLIMSYSLINGRRKKSPAKCKKNYRIIDLDNFKNP